MVENFRGFCRLASNHEGFPVNFFLSMIRCFELLYNCESFPANNKKDHATAQLFHREQFALYGIVHTIITYTQAVNTNTHIASYINILSRRYAYPSCTTCIYYPVIVCPPLPLQTLPSRYAYALL